MRNRNLCNYLYIYISVSRQIERIIVVYTIFLWFCNQTEFPFVPTQIENCDKNYNSFNMSYAVKVSK